MTCRVIPSVDTCTRLLLLILLLLLLGPVNAEEKDANSEASDRVDRSCCLLGAVAVPPRLADVCRVPIVHEI